MDASVQSTPIEKGVMKFCGLRLVIHACQHKSRFQYSQQYHMPQLSDLLGQSLKDAYLALHDKLNCNLNIQQNGARNLHQLSQQWFIT